MPTYRIGAASLDLKIVGVGLRGGILPRPRAAPDGDWADRTLSVDSEPGVRADLEAFAAVGWRFLPGTDLDWAEVRRLNDSKELQAGLLARRPTGRLVILQNCLSIQFKPGVAHKEVARRYPASVELGFADNLFVVQLPLPGHDLEGTIRRELDALVASGEVVFAEPSLIYRLGRPAGPRPVQYGTQWQWDKIHLYQAWKKCGNQGKGSRVAVVDLGFYPDRALQNVALTATFDDQGRPIPNGKMPPDTHGTFCAGLVGARDDDDGLTGAAPDCKLVLVALPPVPTQAVLGTQDLLGCALEFCADPSRWGGGLQPSDGADVISCSLGDPDEDTKLGCALMRAIDFAHNHGRVRNGKSLGCPIVWAVFDVDQEIQLNSINAYAPLLSVSQCNKLGRRVDSGWGHELAFLAPGDGVVGIYHDQNGRSVLRWSGASLAAPCAAGVAALILALKPDLGWDHVGTILKLSCDPQSQSKQWDPYVGWGLLDALQAVELTMKSQHSSSRRRGHK
jgi:subtilisin family serine protease